MSIRPAGPLLIAGLAGLLLVSAPRLAAEEGKYLVVGKDGAVTSLSGPPERKGERYVGRLLKGGQLVSFAAAEVDDARTADANAPRPVPTARPDTNVLKRKPAASPDSRKLRVRREEAEATLGSASGTGRPAEPAAAGPEARPPAPGGFVALDRNGRGEAWWQKRAAPIQARAARAESDLTRAAAARDAWQRSPGAGTPAWQVRLHRLEQGVSKAQAKVDEAARQQERLADDARRAGAYPGWIR